MILHIRKFRIIPYEVGPRTFSKKKKFNLKKKKKEKKKERKRWHWQRPFAKLFIEKKYILAFEQEILLL